MLIFCHLFVGIVIGLIFAVIFKNKFAVLFGAVGGILPDLIDKPLGHLILSETIGNGRIYAHSCVFIGALIILGVILFAVNHEKIAVLCIAAGALSHQLLDFMWTQTDVWFWPFAGPFISDAGIQKILSGYQPVIIFGAVELLVCGIFYILLARK
ncbi:MAG: metal-dependent hydrolase, partial [Methanocorpusculum sp.]|nr:metal-dependent hydrolase [Methanocorpusculum sp.]